MFASFIASMMARPIVAWLWQYKWWIAGGAATLATMAYIGFLRWQVDHYSGQAKEWRDAAEQAERINGFNLAALGVLQAEKALNEHILTERAAKKSEANRRLNALLDHILATEPSNACAASPAVRSAFDGLRSQDGQP